MTDDLLWYAGYGSNLDRRRFCCYLQGGRPPGAARAYPGVREPGPPRDDRAFTMPGVVRFAFESPTWGGGVAFYDADGEGRTLARAYLVTRRQLVDVLEQEMWREPVADHDLAEVLAARRQQVGPGRYETLHLVGELDERPVLTFSAPDSTTSSRTRRRRPTCGRSPMASASPTGWRPTASPTTCSGATASHRRGRARSWQRWPTRERGLGKEPATGPEAPAGRLGWVAMPTRPSPLAVVSLVVSVLALLAALGGGAYAVARIDGRTLVDGSVPGSKLLGNSVTGDQVDEASLDGVARSSRFRRVHFTRTTTGNVAPTQVLALGATRVSFSCSYDDGHTNWAMFGTSARGRTGWDLGSVLYAAGPNLPQQNGGVLDSQRQFLSSGGASSGQYFREVGTIVFNNDKRRETISFSFAVFVSASSTDGFCNLAGTAYRTTG